MTVLRINKAQSVNEVEDELRHLQDLPTCDLQLPVKVKESSIGGEAALIQLIITWAKKCPDRRLITHVQASQDASRQLGRMVKTGFGFVGCLMASDIFDLAEHESLARTAYGLASDRVDAMNRGVSDVAHGNRVLLACVDHSTKWQLAPLYFADAKVKSKREFQHLAESLVAVRAPDKTQLESFSDTAFRGLGVILHELFRNTHDWARTDVAGVPLKKSVRGVLVDSRRLDSSAVRKAADGSPPLMEYISHSQIHDPNGWYRWVEVSIFDSGPGLASRWLGSKVHAGTNPQTEYDACMECLQKHKSTSGHTHAGIGLYEVMRTLSPLSGFARLRTGHLSLFRDFVRSPLSSTEARGAQEMVDWERGDQTFTQKAFVDGTLLTLIIPFVPEGGYSK